MHYVFIFLHFFHIENLGKFNPQKKIEKIFEFTLWKKKIPKISQFICQKIEKFRHNLKNHW
jgi:hypothetical protein